VLVRIGSCGICGGDIQRMAGLIKVKTPQILGHEPAGVVAEVGSEVDSFRAGNRVVLTAVGCGECYYCKIGLDNICDHIASGFGVGCDGAFAEYCRVPARQLFPLPEGMPLEAGSVLTASTGTVFHAIRKSGVVSGDTAVIFGAGCLGTQALQLLRLQGVRVFVIDIAEEKLELARKLGAAEAFDGKSRDVTAEIRNRTGGRGADVAFEMAGQPRTLGQALDCVRGGGTVVDVGSIMEPVSLKMMPFIDGGLSLSREITLMTISHYCRRDMTKLLDLLSHADLDFVSGTYKVALSEINHGFEVKRQGRHARVLVVPD
jgi:threonine dehydrogenase-like Zn-dependent dehydrogenase